MAIEQVPANTYAGIWWWHQIDLGNGVITPGVDRTIEKIGAVRIPERLDGQTVLDIGAWDGAFSFECERRGAARVVATDHYCWHNGADRGFDFARRTLGSHVEKFHAKVEELDPATLGTFDLVLFLGVLYHSEDPMLYLRKVRAMCRGKAIIETAIDALDYGRPAMVFYRPVLLQDDRTNFWGPNLECVEQMLLEVGFREIRMVNRWLPGRAVFHASL